MEPLALQGGHPQGRPSDVLAKDPSHSEARQRLAAVIEEDAPRFVRRDLALAQVGAQSLRRLGPQRAAALFPALAAQPDARGRIQSEVTRLYPHDLADPGPGVEHE